MNPAELDARILALVAAGEGGPRSARAFESLAFDLFAHQYEANAPYRRLCDADGATPATVLELADIPACPTDAFKHYELTTFPVADAVACYRTSGTTAEAAGRHWMPTLALYEAAARASFEWYCYCDGRPPRHVVLFPTPDEAPDSSLGAMLAWMAGPPGSDGTIWDAAVPGDCADAVAALRAAVAAHEPVAVLGTAFALVHLCDALAVAGGPVPLPPGSWVLETGGYKGRSRELDRAALHALVSRSLGVAQAMIVNEYGMTEMGSQTYDGVLRAALGHAGPADRVKRPPPWCRSWVVDPADPRVRAEVADGATGLLKHMDLINRGSVATLLTGDRARRVGDGYEVLGRATDAELRGCSLRMEQLATP